MSYEFPLIADTDFVYTSDLGNREIIFLGSESLDTYVKVSLRSIDYVKYIVDLMRREIPRNEIAQKIKAEYPDVYIDLDSFISKLADAGLFEGSKRVFDDEMELAGIRIFRKSFPQKGKSGSLVLFASGVYRIFSKALVLIPLLLIVSILLVKLKGFEFASLRYNSLDNYISNGVALVGMTVVCFFLHECGHAIAAIGNGVKPKDFSLGVYLGVVPTFYFRYYNLKVASSLTKLKIVLAGVYSNLLFALLSFVGSYLVDSAFSGFLVGFSTLNILMILGNIMPMHLSDGYYAISLIVGKFDMRISFWRSVLGVRKIMRLSRPMALYFAAMAAAVALTIVSLGCRIFLFFSQGNYVLGSALLVVLIGMFTVAILNIVRKSVHR